MQRVFIRVTRLVGVLGLLLAASLSVQAESRWDSKFAEFDRADAQQMPEPGGALFVGSSSVTRWKTDSSFPKRNVINRGFGGSQTHEQLEHIDRIVWKYEPKVVVYYCGDNDINAKKTPEQTAKNILAFQQKIAERLPNTDFVYLPIKPSLKRWAMWDDMQAVNAIIKQAASESDRFHYCDIATPMLNAAGEPKPELFVSDGLHMSEEGYVLWNAHVETLLKALEAAR